MQTLTRELRGVNAEDGTPHYHYGAADPKNTHVVYTGRAIVGRMPVLDGTLYDVGDLFVAVASIRHAVELANAIGDYYAEQGHPLHRDGVEFVHYAMAYPGDATMALAGVAGENAALNGLDGTGSTNVIGFMSLHTASPSTTGANENANSGSYARQTAAWNAASSGNKTNSGGLTFSTLGSIAVTHFGTWNSATYGAGNYAIGGAFGSSVTAASITIAAGAATLSAA